MIKKSSVILPVLASTLMLAGCFYSHTTERAPPAYPPPASVATCVFAGQAYTAGARLTTPEARTVECGSDGVWHTVM